MIRAERIRAGYDDGAAGESGAPRRRLVLDGIDLEVHRGEAVALVGANGSGKTTLLRVLAGLAEPWEGRVLFDGKDLATAEGRGAARRGIGVLFSNPEGTLVAPTVEREIAFGLENHRWEREAMRARVGELLERFDLEEHAARSPLALSGGERTRVALAAAMATRPSCLLVDEALSFLDARHRAAARETIDRARREEGAALLWATQDFEEVLVADRILVLREGRIASEVARERLVDAAPGFGSMDLRFSALWALRASLLQAGLQPGREVDPAAMAGCLDRAWREGPSETGPDAAH